MLEAPVPSCICPPAGANSPPHLSSQGFYAGILYTAENDPHQLASTPPCQCPPAAPAAGAEQQPPPQQPVAAQAAPLPSSGASPEAEDPQIAECRRCTVGQGCACAVCTAGLTGQYRMHGSASCLVGVSVLRGGGDPLQWSASQMPASEAVAPPPLCPPIPRRHWTHVGVDIGPIPAPLIRCTRVQEGRGV